VGEHDKVRVIPNIDAQITHDESVLVRNYRITVPHLSPNEEFSVLVDVSAETPNKLGGPFVGDLSIKVAMKFVHAVTFLRSESGPGLVQTTQLREPNLIKTEM